MGFWDSLKDKTIGIDTSLFIYYIEEHKKYIKFLDKFFEKAYKKQFYCITSVITLIEVLIHPFKNRKFDLANKYFEILTGSKEIKLCELNSEIAKESAFIRAKYDVKTPDAIQIATSIKEGANFFITNDKRLKRIKELKILVLDEILKYE